MARWADQESPVSLVGATVPLSPLDRRSQERFDPRLLQRLLDVSGGPASGGTVVLPHAKGHVPVRVEKTPEGRLRPRLAYRAPQPDDLTRAAAFLGRVPDTGTGSSTAAGRAIVAVRLPEVPESTGTEGTDTLSTGTEGSDTASPDTKARAADDHAPGVQWQEARRVGSYLSPLDLDCMLTALALTNWHRRTRFCSRCGASLHPHQAGWVLRCGNEHEHYPRTDPAMIVAVIDPQDRILLGRNESWVPGRRSVLAGFLDAGERGAAAVAREVAEEVGVKVTKVRYVDDQPWPFPGSLMLGYEARTDSSYLNPDLSEIVEAEWYTREQLAEAVGSGRIGLPSRMSIARRLIERWFGGPLAALEDAGGRERYW